MSQEKKYLEIESKYSADNISRLDFKSLLSTLNPKNFLYVESKDVYYTKGENEFLRHRNRPNFGSDERSELTFKKKHISTNNIVRTEVNLRVDKNSAELVEAFCKGLGYEKNFSVEKFCDIYYFDDGDVVYYSVIDEEGKTASFLEIECDEDADLTEDQAREVISKYEKLLAPIGITPQKRMKLSLFERYRK